MRGISWACTEVAHVDACHACVSKALPTPSRCDCHRHARVIQARYLLSLVEVACSTSLGSGTSPCCVAALSTHGLMRRLRRSLSCATKRSSPRTITCHTCQCQSLPCDWSWSKSCADDSRAAVVYLPTDLTIDELLLGPDDRPGFGRALKTAPWDGAATLSSPAGTMSGVSAATVGSESSTCVLRWTPQWRLGVAQRRRWRGRPDRQERTRCEAQGTIAYTQTRRVARIHVLPRLRLGPCH